MEDIKVPMDVPKSKRKRYIKNYKKATNNSNRLMLFAGDQKIEHLNADFYGENISPDDNKPEHLFKIADKSKIGVFATQMGLISKYGMDYKDIPYLVKMNSKTNLVPTEVKDPYSEQLYDFEDLMEFKKSSNLNILGVGYTIYLGSKHEPKMLRKAAKLINNAHKEGMIAVLWIYPRGEAVDNEKSPDLIAGACGVASCLGSDFVKVNYTKQVEGKENSFKQAIMAAGRTGVVCSGGSSVNPEDFLKRLKEQIEIGASGNATGRNIHQKDLDKAVKMCNAIYAITVEDKSVEEALNILK